MKKQTKSALAILLVLSIIAFPWVNATESEAATSRVAYSIGVNHGTSGDLTGDFTPNVTIAKARYSMIDDVNSKYTFKPTRSILSSAITKDIVFLNGHASADNILFNHNNLGGSYACGVHRTLNGTSSSTGYSYVGLTSTDMSSVDLISFVGCKTAEGSSNLAKTARSEGATTSVGFTESITSRSTQGQTWLTYYNNMLGMGESVGTAINTATAACPCDLGLTVKVYGSSTNTIGSSSKTKGVEIQTVNDAIGRVEDKAMLNSNVNNADLLSYKKVFKAAIETIKEYDTTFDINNYKVDVNIYDEENGNGFARLTYYIDGVILTNYGYMIDIQNSKQTNIYPCISKNDVDFSALTNKLVLKLDKFEKSSTKLNLEKLTSNESEYRELYYYDFLTRDLKYIVTSFEESPEGVIVETTEETTL